MNCLSCGNEYYDSPACTFCGRLPSAVTPVAVVAGKGGARVESSGGKFAPCVQFAARSPWSAGPRFYAETYYLQRVRLRIGDAIWEYSIYCGQSDPATLDIYSLPLASTHVERFKDPRAAPAV